MYYIKTGLVIRIAVAAWMAGAPLCRGAQPVRLASQPQKFCTFYALDDPHVPGALRQRAKAAHVVATDGP